MNPRIFPNQTPKPCQNPKIHRVRGTLSSPLVAMHCSNNCFIWFKALLMTVA